MNTLTLPGLQHPANRETSIAQFLEIEQIYSQTLGRGIRSLAVSACNGQEGCSLLARSLAQRVAATGRKALLVDMNLYRPSFGQHYQLPRSHWSPEALEADTIQRDVEPNVDVVTATLNAPMAFRDLPALRQLVKNWEAEVDAIIFDTSPFKAVNRQNIPAELVCAAAEASLMVVRSGVTSESDLAGARAKLDRVEANLIGTILNDIDNPSLSTELQRECDRLARWLPGLSRWLKRRIRSSQFLNLPV